VPRKHSVELTIDPSQPTFEGRIAIEIELRKSTAVLWLHAKDITASEASVVFGGTTRKARAEAAGGEFLGLELDSPIGPGRATVAISYRGKLDEKAVVGPYRKQSEGEWYAFTTFTPIDAASRVVGVRPVSTVQRYGHDATSSFIHPTVAASAEWFRRYRYSESFIFHRSQDAELWFRSSASSRLRTSRSRCASRAWPPTKASNFGSTSSTRRATQPAFSVRPPPTPPPPS
jgi:hypothetical protein